VISVFGCGGDRDKSKRKLMGKVSELNSDLTIVTSDNPRSEEPTKIIEDVLEGVDQKSFMVEPDRARAIFQALELAQESPSCVLIAGKGHEKTQEVKGVKKDFSDLAEVLKFKVRN
jgi:UDP-N-acetylmuramoyl-L-alanyl-D-glutamate--2,6-diaminopimelate ligase